MERAKKTSVLQLSSPVHDEAVTRANESTTLLMSGNSTTGSASNLLSAYSITDSPQKATRPLETSGTVKSMEMALKILHSPPVIPPLSGGLERYRNNVSDIQQAFESALGAKTANECSKNWKKCEITAKVLFAVLNEKQGEADCLTARNALKQWVQSYFLLTKTNRNELLAYPESPVKTRDEFVAWCHAVARAASTGTGTIGKDASLEYLCNIQALNAGCAEARLLIVRDHLLGRLYHKPPSHERFLPREAEALLKVIAVASKERLPKPEGLDETHYKIIYDLVDLIRSDSKDRENERDMLVLRLITSNEFEIQQLAPMLYLQNAYGNIDTKMAHRCLVTISLERCEEMKVLAFNLVYQYWFAEMGIAKGSISTGIRRMEAMAADMYPAALYSLIEYGQSHNAENYTARSLLLLDKLQLAEICKRLKKNCLHHCKETIEYMEFLCEGQQNYFMWIVAPSYNSPLAHKIYTFWRGFDAKMRRCDDRVNELMDYHFRMLETVIISGSTIDRVNHFLSSAYTAPQEITNKENLGIPLSNLNLPNGSVTKLRLAICEIENKMPFVDDPQILVFRHFSDFLTKGKADEKLLDKAMAQNSVATCYRLLSLNHCTEIWGYNKLIAKLLGHAKVSIDLQNLCRDDAGLNNFINIMNDSHTMKYPEAYCQLMNSISKWIDDKDTLIAIYRQIAVRKLIQGNKSDADRMHQKAMALMARDPATSHNKIKNRHRILRSSMPKYFLDIYEAGFHWSHSCNLRYDFDTLIRTGEHLLQHSSDPAAHLAWCYRITPFFLNQYLGKSRTLKDISQVIAAYELQKKISSKISRLNQEMMIYTVKRVQHFIENLPDEVSQETVRKQKQLNEAIAEIRSIAKKSTPHQFVSCQESSANSKGDNHNLSAAEPGNDISECTMVTDDIYPAHDSPNDFYKDITNFITEHILAPKIRKTPSLQRAMELFNQLNKSDDFNSVRFTVLLIDTISRMTTEFVPEVMERLCFCLERLKNDCERSVKCFSQHILRYNILFLLKNFAPLFPEMMQYLSVEFEALKTRIWVAYPEIAFKTSISRNFFLEEKSSAISKGVILGRTINSLNALLVNTKISDTNNALLIIKYIRIIANRESFEKRFKLGEIGKGKEMAKLIRNILRGKLDYHTLSLRCKNDNKVVNTALIWLALEAGKLNDATLNKIVDTKLEKTSAEYHFLKCLLASEPATITYHIKIFLKSVKPGAEDSAAYQKKESHAIAILHKLFAINDARIISRFFMASSSKLSYFETMLHWRHPAGRLFDDATMDEFSKVLVTSGRGAMPEASCRLLDFILEQEGRGKAVSAITVYQCCRFIHARSFIATDEQTLYQGITLFLGKGCVSDKEEGLQLINQALASNSPIPALRMARLQEQRLFPANVLEQDCLKLFAQKADTDQELYRDYKQVIFIELLLSLGESGLDWLIRQLKSAPDDDISSSRIAELFQKKLDIWRENGIKSTQQSSLPEEKNVAATVISKQPSQSVVKPKSDPIRSKRTKGIKQEGRQDRKPQSVPRPAVRHEKPVTSQQLLEQLVVKNKDKAVSEISGEEITEVLKLLEQLKQKTTTAIRDLSKNRLANLVRMLPWSATILGEVMAAHLKNMTDSHARASYARQQIERYECLISEQLTVTGDSETQPQGTMEKKQATGKLLMQQPVPPGIQELIKNTTQVHQEALLSGNLLKDELLVAVSKYPDLYLHYLREANKPDINCVKSIWEGLGATDQTALLIKTGAILITDQCGTDQDSAIKILNDEKLSNDTRLSLFLSLGDKSKEALLMLSEGIPDNLVRAYLERMKRTHPKQDTIQHQIRSINQWQTSLEKRLTDNLIHLLKELPSGAEEADRMKFRGFREALKKEMDSKIESTRASGTSLNKDLARCFKASAILMELKVIAKAEAKQETLQPG